MTNTNEVIHKYVVCADTIVVEVGSRLPSGKQPTTRVVRGGVINGVDSSPQIQTFIRQGAIRKAKDAEQLARMQADLSNERTSKLRLTTRKIYAQAVQQGSEAAADPVAKLQPEVQPVAAPNPVITAGAIETEPSE